MMPENLHFPSSSPGVSYATWFEKSSHQMADKCQWFSCVIDYPRQESEAPTWEMRRGYNSEEEDPTCPEKKHFPEPPCLIGIIAPMKIRTLLQVTYHCGLRVIPSETPTKNTSQWGFRQPQPVPVLSESKGKSLGSYLQSTKPSLAPGESGRTQRHSQKAGLLRWCQW